MGLFNFWKSAGKKVDTQDDGGPDPEALKREVQALGIDAEKISLAVSGDKVEVSGDGLDAEEREKVILAVGNVEGVATVEADAPDEGQFHTVEKGDSLWKIAERTLGDGNRYREIFEANRPMLDDPDKIYPGQVLRIPQSRTA